MSHVTFAMLVHSHQPVGNFAPVFEEAYQKSYHPFLSALSHHPRIRASLHYSGILLEWLEAHHPEFFRLLRQLIEREQVELLGGGFYEPILPAIPDADKVAQVRRLSAYLRDKFGLTPRGAWVAERVWEPGLARPLAEAGVEYVTLDDTHFLAAGLEPAELQGYYLTEEVGYPLRLIPALKSLRYTIPFREPLETMRILEQGRAPGRFGPQPALFVFSDDCEKFGVWPGTFEHCYRHFWLERFLHAIESAGEWLRTATLADCVAGSPPWGRVYLPTAAYPEMMEWALPEGASREFRSCREETERLAGGDRCRRFLTGGLWRNFLRKYPESNQIHKLMLRISRRWQALHDAGGSPERSQGLSEAHRHLLAGQCNDAYWHGAFGGLYAPHLRSGILRELIRAEAILDRLEPDDDRLRIESTDFDLDGSAELLVDHPAFGLVIKPSDGATVSSLRFKPADAELINSLRRRPEVYHDRVRQQAGGAGAEAGHPPASIHERVASKEANLAAYLAYDRYARHALRTYVFPATRTWEDFAGLNLEESDQLAGGAWSLASQAPPAVFEFRREARTSVDGRAVRLEAIKRVSTQAVGEEWEVACRLSVTAEAPPGPLALGLELVFNLLAPDAADRYYRLLADGGEVRRPLGFQGELGSASHLFIVDGWQHVEIELEAEPGAAWWMAPIYTVSQSEAGFERVYQGSAILAVWKAPAGSDGVLRAALRARIRQPEKP